MTQALLKDKASPFIAADNDNHSGDLPDDIVLRAARYLVARHSPQSPVDLKAFDVPHKALADIAAQLEDMGLSYAMSDSMLEPLRGYVVQNGGEFANTTRAKPIAVHVCIRNSLPPRRFENGMTELVFVGRKQARVEGASSINVRLTANGTAMTSNAANVDAMFANVGETGLWIRFEAPTKEELDGLMSAMESGLAGVAQAVGGAMDAADLKRILEMLQKAGTLTPQVETLIAFLIELQKTLAAKGALSPDKIADIVAKISETLSNPDHIDLIPPSFAEAVLDTLQSLATHPAVAPALAANGFTHLVEAETLRVQETMLETAAETLRGLLAADDLDPQAAVRIMELLADVESALDVEDGATPEMMQSIVEKIVEVADMPDIPVDALIALTNLSERMAEPTQDTPEIAVIPSQEMAESLYDLIEEIAQKIEAGEVDPDTLPESVKAMLESIADLKAMEANMGREAVIAEIAKALDGQGDPAIAMQIETIVLSLAKPEVQAVLPPAMAEFVQNFMAENPAIIETVATNAIVRVLQEQVQGLPQDAPKVDVIKQEIETIKAEGLVAVVLDAKTLSILSEPVQVVLKEHPVLGLIDKAPVLTPVQSFAAVAPLSIVSAVATPTITPLAPAVRAASAPVVVAPAIVKPITNTPSPVASPAPTVNKPTLVKPVVVSTPASAQPPRTIQIVKTTPDNSSSPQLKTAEVAKMAAKQPVKTPAPVKLVEAVVKPVTLARQLTNNVISNVEKKVAAPVQRVTSSLKNFVTSTTSAIGGIKGFLGSLKQVAPSILRDGRKPDAITPTQLKDALKVKPEKKPASPPNPPPRDRDNDPVPPKPDPAPQPTPEPEKNRVPENEVKIKGGCDGICTCFGDAAKDGMVKINLSPDPDTGEPRVIEIPRADLINDRYALAKVAEEMKDFGGPINRDELKKAINQAREQVLDSSVAGAVKIFSGDVGTEITGLDDIRSVNVSDLDTGDWNVPKSAPRLSIK